MKKLFLGFLMLVLTAGMMNAQDAKKDFKAARKAYNKYNLNPETGFESAVTAYGLIEKVLATDDYKANFDAWLLNGQILNVMADKPEKYPSAGKNAASAYIKAYSLAVKGYQKTDSDLINGLNTSAIDLNSAAIDGYNNRDFDKAYENFNALTEVSKLMKEMGIKSLFATDKEFNDLLINTGMTAKFAGRNEEALSHFEGLYKDGMKDARIFENLFSLTQGDEEKSMKYLDEGLKLFPDDKGLKYAQINFFLKSDRFEELVEKLKIAISEDPENTSLYVTLGNVYDRLYQKEIAAGNKDAAEVNRSKALDYYEQTIVIADKADGKEDKVKFDATYSIGALYFNRGADVSKKMQDLPLSAVKEYEAMNKEVNNLFDSALPYFKNCVEMDDTDTNTLIALKEIYARKDMLDESKKYKTLLDNLKKD